MIPQEPAFLGETGLDAAFAAELALKALDDSAHPTAGELAETLAVSVPVIQEVLTQATRDSLCEIVAGEGQTHAAYRYRLSSRGLERAAAAFERNAYVGPAPVPLRDYVAQVRRQSAGGSGFTADVVRQALSMLVLSDSTRSRVGRAIFSGRPTLIARAFRQRQDDNRPPAGAGSGRLYRRSLCARGVRPHRPPVRPFEA